MNTYCITTIETIEHVYRIEAETEDKAMELLKTEVHDSEYTFIDEEFETIKLEED